MDGDTFQVQIPEDRSDTFAQQEGKSVIFGIRPEDIHNPEYAPPGIIAQPVEAKVDVTELMGNEIFVYLKTGEQTFVARVDPRSRYHINDDIQVVFYMVNMHIFDRETELSIRQKSDRIKYHQRLPPARSMVGRRLL